MWLRRVTYENLRRNNNRRNSRSDSRKVFALRPETALRIYTYAPDRHSLPVRQTLPSVRKTEEKTVRGLLLQILTRLRKILTIINYGEATLLPPRFLFFNPSSQRRPFLFRHRERSVATLGRVALSPSRYARHLSRFNGRAYPKIGVRTPMQFTPSFRAGLPRSLRSLAKTSFFILSSRR